MKFLTALLTVSFPFILLAQEPSHNRFETTYRKYITKEQNAFVERQKGDIDSLFFEAFRNLLIKKMSFVKLHKTETRALLLFKEEIAPVCFPFSDLFIDSFSVFFKNTFSAAAQNSKAGKAISKRLAEKAIGYGVNIPAPDFMVRDIYGETKMLSDFKGKYLLINFWATWCVPCMQEMPQIKALYDSTNRSRLDVLSISADKDSLAFLKVVIEGKYSWLHVFNDKQIRSVFGGIPAWPQVFLIDPKGIIIYNSMAEKNQDSTIVKIAAMVKK